MKADTFEELMSQIKRQLELEMQEVFDSCTSLNSINNHPTQGAVIASLKTVLQRWLVPEVVVSLDANNNYQVKYSWTMRGEN